MSANVAILLCAGYGTRMGALTASTPKPLLTVAGRPVIDYLVDQLASWPELATVHVVSNSRYAAAFRAWAGGQAALPFRLEIHDDGSSTPDDRRGAVGDLAFVLDTVGYPDGALVAAGDNVLRFVLRPLWDAFLARREPCVLALREDDPARLRKTGVLELADDGRVRRLWEKPSEPPSSWACPPFYALTAAALRRLPAYLAAGHPSDEIGRFIAHLAEREPVWVTRVDGRRLDVGSPESYRRADEILRREPVLFDGVVS